MRATMVSPRTDEASMVFIERGHATLFRMPEDARLLEAMARLYEQEWDEGKALKGIIPVVEGVSVDEVSAALKGNVPQYRELRV